MARCSVPRRLVGVALLVVFTSAPAVSQDAVTDAAPSPGARLAAGTIQAPEGYTVTAVASEPLLSNPVAFCFDPSGRMFVAETHRIHNGVEDNRGHMDWLDDDLAARTVEDRRAFFERRLGDRIGRYREASELVRLVEDRDGDGVYDASNVFAGGFNDVVDGAAAGVMWMGDRLWLTCIPSLWELRDKDGDGVAEERKALASGFGVHVALFGHDMHGLTVGPDGLIYFSIGDRGLHVEVDDSPGSRANTARVLSNPDSGAVLRCRPDGSGLHLFATGLRNPQELAFNEYGDLFTVDNNSDGGDRARLVHIVEGMQVGWKISYQYLSDRGPFMRERVWEPQNPAQPASIVPPVANITDGPSGLAYYPGTGMSEDCRGGFFICDFRGSSSTSGVRKFHVEQAGAGYRLTDDEQYIGGVLATDCDFGPDGNLHVLDWLEGWNGTGNGRVFRVTSDDKKHQAELKDVAERIQEAKQAEVNRLVELLGHADLRVRQAAQRRLVGRDAFQALADAAANPNTPLLARIHAIWQFKANRGEVSRYDLLASLLQDADAEVRNQAARALSCLFEGGYGGPPDWVGERLAEKLTDPSPRVRSSAAISLGRLRHGPALEGLLQLARDNADRDPVLRHSAAFGLAGSQKADGLVAAANGAGESEQLAIVVALGYQKSPRVGELLSVESEPVALEAARVIWDTPIPEAYPALAAAVADERWTSEPLLRRALAAALADGSTERLEQVIALALRPGLDQKVRDLAWDAVRQWSNPSPRDPVHGLWRPAAPRSAEQTRETLASLWPRIAEALSEDVAGVVVAAELGVADARALLLGIIADERQAAALRVRAVEALRDAEEAMVDEAMAAALASASVEVRIAARILLVDRNPRQAAGPLVETAESDEMTITERQAAIRMLAGLRGRQPRRALRAWLDRVETGDCPPALVLDVLEAAEASRDETMAERAAAFRQKLVGDDALAPFAMCLDGGNVAEGELVYRNKEAVSCRRCHSLKPNELLVGPSLSDVGAKRTRAELLESIVKPNAKITEGFQTTKLLLDTGVIVSGIMRRQDDAHMVLIDPDGKEQTVELAEIEERLEGLSAMPEDLVTHLTPRELRDLVEFLAAQRTAAPEGAAASGHGEAEE